MSEDSYFADLGKIIFQYSGDRDTAENVLWFTSSGITGATETALNTLAASVYGLWAAAVTATLPTVTVITGCIIADWTSASGLTGSISGTDAGTGGGGPLPAQTAVLVNWATNGRFKGGHPRTYLPGPAFDLLLNNQQLTAAAANSLEANLTSFLSDFNGLTIDSQPCELVLYHRGPTAKFPDRIAQGTRPIVAPEVAQRFATQRRRVRRVGHIR